MTMYTVDRYYNTTASSLGDASSIFVPDDRKWDTENRSDFLFF